MSEPPTITEQDVVALVPAIRRAVAKHVRDETVVEDLVQETLARVIAARSRIEGDLAPYAVVTARNLLASHAERNDRARRNAHLLVEFDLAEGPAENLLREEERGAVQAALTRLSDLERDLLVAHEVHGASTSTLAAQRDTTPGAVAAQLARIRAKLRVEYLFVREAVEPPTDQCRPVLRALSAGDRRRAAELDADGHLLACTTCSRLHATLTDLRTTKPAKDEIRVPISSDVDVVNARQSGREVAGREGFSATDCTLIATGISELARNIVRFAGRGEVLIAIVEGEGNRGVRVVARDAGPGIPDTSRAMQDGYSTYDGLGLGLPGCRRLMDEFILDSKVGEGTTVSMTKWNSRPRASQAGEGRKEGNR